MASSHFLKLNTGARMPVLGLGTFGGGDKLAAALDYALHCGYRHIDTAWSYKTQPAIGEVLHGLEKQDKIKREELFITSKVTGNLLTEEGVKHVLDESLEELKTPYVDMLLIHSLFGSADAGHLNQYEESVCDINKGWSSLEMVMATGKAKAIGVSNMSASQMDKITQMRHIKISNAQSECHAYLQQVELRKYCMQMGIVFTAFGPLGAPGKPKWHTSASDPPRLLNDPVIHNIAHNMGKTPAQILLRFMVQLGVCVVPKSITLERIKENAEIFDFKLAAEDMDLIRSVNRNARFYQFKQFQSHKHFPHKENF